MGAALFGYTKLYGEVPGRPGRVLRVPQAHFGPIKVPEGPPDDRFLFLSDVLPTAWQAVEYAAAPRRRHVAVHRPRPIGEMSSRIALHRGAGRSSDSTWSRTGSRAPSLHGVQTLDVTADDDVPAAVRELTDGRGPDAVIDAVGMEAHGAPVGKLAHTMVGLLPDAVARR